MAAPVFDVASSTQFIGFTTSASWSHTCSGTNRILYVQIHGDRSAPNASTSVTYNGVAMSLVARKNTGTANQGNDGSMELWELVAPASGTNTVAWAGNAGSVASIIGKSSSFNDTDQSTPKGTVASANAMNTNVPRLTVTGATGDLLVWYSSGQQPGLSYTPATLTSIYSSNSFQENCGQAAGAASQSVGYNIDFAEDLCAISFCLKPVSGGGGATAVTFGSHPTSGAVSTASSNITIGVDATPITGTVIVTPATNLTGTFSPTTVSLTTGSPSATVTFTPAVSGVHTISSTNNGSLSNPATFTYTAQPAITVTLVASPSDSTPQTGLSSLHWRWFDITDINSASAPTDRGSTGTTNGSGVFTVNLPNSTKTNGQTGFLDITNSTGVTVAMGFVDVT